MRASVSTALTEAHQEVDLAVLLMPEAAFLVLGYLVLPARHKFRCDTPLRFWVCSDSVLSLASACSLCEDLHRAVGSVSGSIPGMHG